MKTGSVIKVWGPVLAIICISFLVYDAILSTTYYRDILLFSGIPFFVLGVYALWRFGAKSWPIIRIWGPFTAITYVSLLAQCNSNFLFPYDYEIVLFCAILSFVLGAYVLRRVGVKPWSVTLVVVGLIVGQRLFLEVALMLLLLKFGGGQVAP